MPVGGATDSGPEHQTDTQGSPRMYGQHNVRTTDRDNTGHTPPPRIEITIFESAGNRTQATATDFNFYDL